MRRVLGLTTVLLGIGIGTVGLAAPASAAAKATTTTSTTTAVAPSSDKTWPWLSAAALGVGVVGAVAVLFFVRRESEATQDTIRRALRLGVSTTIDDVTATAAAERAAAEGKPVVEGLSQVDVGREHEYTAKVGGQPTPATWRVDPAGFVELPQGAVATLRITPQKTGTFNLTAVVQRNASEPLQVTAAAPVSSQASAIPFVGEGWGSIVVAMVVAGVVTALGFVRILSGEALAGFYGALIGYVFHKAADERSKKGSKSNGANGGNQ